jgi:hypothetical protein
VKGFESRPVKELNWYDRPASITTHQEWLSLWKHLSIQPPKLKKQSSPLLSQGVQLTGITPFYQATPCTLL